MLNDLISHALHAHLNYDFFFRVDADDINLENRFKIQSEYLKSNPDIDVLGGSALIIDQFGEEIGQMHKPNDQKNILKRFPYSSPFIHPTVVFQRSVFRRI